MATHFTCPVVKMRRSPDPDISCFPCLTDCDGPNSVIKFYLQTADKKLTATVFLILFHTAVSMKHICLACFAKLIR